MFNSKKLSLGALLTLSSMAFSQQVPPTDPHGHAASSEVTGMPISYSFVPVARLSLTPKFTQAVARILRDYNESIRVNGALGYDPDTDYAISVDLQAASTGAFLQAASKTVEGVKVISLIVPCDDSKPMFSARDVADMVIDFIKGK